MPKGRPITLYEREKIETYLRMKKEKKWIADKLNRDYSIIKREIKRNSGEFLPYVAEVANKLARQRARKTNIRKLEKPKNIELKKFVEDRIVEDYSPDQIAGRLKENPPDNITETISHESIYDYIYNYSEKQKELYKHLRTGRKKRQRHFSRKNQKDTIKNRVSIHLRPGAISKKRVWALGK